MTTRAEENYLKAIFKIAERDSKAASTNAIAREMNTSAASVTDMIKRLSEKGLVEYQRYRGATLSSEGRVLATSLVRRHRLWESFLVDKLNFKWNEVHEIAEELEHVPSDALISRLDAFLGHPRFDPHGDPIPSEEGKFTLRSQTILADIETGTSAEVVAVREHDDSFLKHLNDIGIALNTRVMISEKYPYDGSLQVEIEGIKKTISEKVARNVYVKTV